MRRNYYSAEHRWKRKASFFFILGIVVIIALVLVQLLRPIAKPVLAATIPSSYQVPGTTHIALPAAGQAAVMASGVGVITSTPNETETPIASLTKIMTAYIVLKKHPLAVGANGPTYTITQQDVNTYKKDAAAGDSVVKVSVGEKLTERQMLEGLLLPSSDNIANTLASWISGNKTAFVQEMNETAKSLVMRQTHYADASGVSPETVSTALDQLKIADAAMSIRAFKDIVNMPQATLPVAGTVYNVNDMLGKNGIVGVKTGSTLEAGGCFVSAMYHQVGNQRVLLVGAILGQGGNQMLQEALSKSVAMLKQAGNQLKSITLSQTQGTVGKYVVPWNHDVPAISSKPVTVIGYPGMTVHFLLNENHNLTIQAGQQTIQVPIYPQRTIPKPSIKWKLLRL